MKKPYRILALAASLSLASAALAQTPPAGSTGICKDGTYSQAASKSGACRGHKGVKEWYSATATTSAAAKTAASSTATTSTTTPAPATAMKATTSAPAAAASTTAPAAAAASSSKVSPQQRAASMTQAPGGGPGLVWFNSESKVYHCSGTTYYGKTKQGQYMTEADAKAKGGHADHNHACTN